jgi:hypothetical protein
MAQITIYVPDELARRLRERARRSRTSLSAYVSALARESLIPTRWPKSFENLYGSCKGQLLEPADAPPERDPSL